MTTSLHDSREHKAVIVHWVNGATTALLTNRIPGEHERFKSFEPLYPSNGVAHEICYTDAVEQLAFAMHSCTVAELSDAEAEQVRHYAYVTVNAAVKIKPKGKT